MRVILLLNCFAGPIFSFPKFTNQKSTQSQYPNTVSKQINISTGELSVSFTQFINCIEASPTSWGGAILSRTSLFEKLLVSDSLFYCCSANEGGSVGLTNLQISQEILFIRTCFSESTAQLLGLATRMVNTFPKRYGKLLFFHVAATKCISETGGSIFCNEENMHEYRFVNSTNHQTPRMKIEALQMCIPNYNGYQGLINKCSCLNSSGIQNTMFYRGADSTKSFVSKTNFIQNNCPDVLLQCTQRGALVFDSCVIYQNRNNVIYMHDAQMEFVCMNCHCDKDFAITKVSKTPQTINNTIESTHITPLYMHYEYASGRICIVGPTTEFSNHLKQRKSTQYMCILYTFLTMNYF